MIGVHCLACVVMCAMCELDGCDCYNAVYLQRLDLVCSR